MRRFGLVVAIVGSVACSADPQGGAGGDDSPPTDGTGDGAASRCVEAPTAPGDPDVVVTEAGEIRGATSDGVRAFLGIPYAAPPVGERRFRAPEPHACWDGVRPAVEYGRGCPQILPSGSRVGSEDCLFANVWTPTTATTKRPVMVFIHGGAYEFGSGSQDLVLEGTGNLYEGRTLAAEHDAIVVTFNYRLGALGFLAHPALSAEDPNGSSGNYGTLDQIALLQWIQTNIGAFGGDPDRVMVFGESAGGLSTCLLMATPLARGLFHAAIIESGGCQVASQPSRFAQGERVADTLDCDNGTDAETAACMRQRSAFDYVVRVAAGVTGPEPSRMWEMLHGPNIDGHVFVEPPLVTLREGRGANVPVIVGSNADEFEIFLPPMSFCSDYYAFIGVTFGNRADEVIARYSCFDHATPRQATVAVMTDHMFTCEARRIARAAARGGAAARRYLFTRTYTDHPLGLLESFHVAELPFVFRTFDVVGYQPTADDVELSRQLGGYWARFAASGDPDGGGAPAWPLYDATADTALRLDVPLATANRVRTEKCDFWDTFVP